MAHFLKKEGYKIFKSGTQANTLIAIKDEPRRDLFIFLFIFVFSIPLIINK